MDGENEMKISIECSEKDVVNLIGVEIGFKKPMKQVCCKEEAKVVAPVSVEARVKRKYTKRAKKDIEVVLEGKTAELHEMMKRRGRPKEEKKQ